MRLYRKEVTVALSFLIGAILINIGIFNRSERVLYFFLGIALIVFGIMVLRHPKKMKNKFFKPTIAKIVLAVLLMIYAYFAVFASYPWGSSPSHLGRLLFYPLLMSGFYPTYFSITQIIPLIILLAYTFLISCALVFVFNLVKKWKWAMVLAIVLLLFLTGIDEPIVNNTVNKVDYSCSVDSDCMVKSTIPGWCGGPKCINKDWEYYSSVINSVMSLSCLEPLLACTCVEGQCSGRNLYESTDLSDCKLVDENYRDWCIRVVERNKFG